MLSRDFTGKSLENTSAHDLSRRSLCKVIGVLYPDKSRDFSFDYERDRPECLCVYTLVCVCENYWTSLCHDVMYVV